MSDFWVEHAEGIREKMEDHLTTTTKPATPAVGLQHAVHVLVSTQHTLLLDVERLTAVLATAEHESDTQISEYSKKLAQSRESVARVSAKLEHLLRRLETVERRLLRKENDPWSL